MGDHQVMELAQHARTLLARPRRPFDLRAFGGGDGGGGFRHAHVGQGREDLAGGGVGDGEGLAGGGGRPPLPRHQTGSGDQGLVRQARQQKIRDHAASPFLAARIASERMSSASSNTTSSMVMGDRKRMTLP